MTVASRCAAGTFQKAASPRRVLGRDGDARRGHGRGLPRQPLVGATPKSAGSEGAYVKWEAWLLKGSRSSIY